MATLSDLQTRFMARVGLSSVSGVERAKIREAINDSVTRAAGDNLPGLTTQEFVGETEGKSTLTISSHTAGSAIVTFSSIPTTTRVGDVVDFGSVTRIVYSRNTTAGTIDFGSPIVSAQTGTADLYQRTVKMPSNGRIAEMINLGEGLKMNPDSSAIKQWGLRVEAISTRYTQHYANGESYAILWPIPSSAQTVSIRQLKSLDNLDTETELDWPDETLNTILTNAIHIWRSWRVGGISPVEAGLSKESVRDAATGKSVSAPSQPRVRKKQ